MDKHSYQTEKELAAALKKHEKYIEHIAAHEDIIKKKEEERKKLVGELKMKDEDKRQQLDATQKIFKEWKTFAADPQKQALSNLHAKDTTIKEAREEISKLVEALREQKEQEEILRGKLASQDEAIKKHEETLPKPLIKNSPLQMVYNLFPECMHSFVAPKGILTGDELGTFMGTLVTTTAYNVSYSNKEARGFLILNTVANLVGSIFGQMCNNVVTHISEADMQKEGFKGIVKRIGKSVIWIFLGGLGPEFVGGFIKKYWSRLAVSAVLSLAMQCITAVAWKRSFEVPTWQPWVVVGLGIFGITIAAGIPHILEILKKLKGL